MIYTLRCSLCYHEASIVEPTLGYPIIHICPNCKTSYVILKMLSKEIPQIYKLTQTKATIIKGPVKNDL